MDHERDTETWETHACVLGREIRWPGCRTVGMLAVTLSMLGVGVTGAEPPDVQPREVASYGPTKRTVTEPAVAAGQDAVVTVFYDRPGGTRHAACYGAFNKNTGKWTEGQIDPRTSHDAVVDLSIAYDPSTHNFLAVGKTATQILTCRFEPGPQLGEVSPRGWDVEVNHYPTLVDKPWIVAGDPSRPTGQEYYIVYMTDLGGGPYAYLRSVDGGQSWCQDLVRLADTGQPVIGEFCAQPVVDGDGPLYIACIAGNSIRFLVGQDVDGAASGPVRFWRLHAPPDDPNDPAPALTVRLNERVLHDDIPGNFPHPMGSTVPQLAVDRANPGRLHLVYHDVAPGTSDVNVYMHTVTRDHEYWRLGPQRQVNESSATTYESDQFMPSMTVDDSGRIHIVYYDDQDYTDSPMGDLQDDNCQLPKFDVFYAWSDDQGQNWSRHKLFLNENPQEDEPALDCTLTRVNPREYIGIAWYGSGEVSEVWTAYTGTFSRDLQRNDAVIWSSLLDWTEGPRDINRLRRRAGP